MIITTPQYNRPHYSRIMMKFLSQCKNIEKYKVVVSIDKSENFDEIYEMWATANFCERIITIHDRLGCNANTKQVLDIAFCFDDYVLHIEDDICVSRYVLDIMEKLIELGILDRFFSLSFYNRDWQNEEGENNIIKNREKFSPWGFGIAKKNYLKVPNCFIGQDINAKGYKSWDCQIDEYCKAHGEKHAYTKMCHAINIGEVGEHMRAEHYKEVKVDVWAENLPVALDNPSQIVYNL